MARQTAPVAAGADDARLMRFVHGLAVAVAAAGVVVVGAAALTSIKGPVGIVVAFLFGASPFVVVGFAFGRFREAPAAALSAAVAALGYAFLFYAGTRDTTSTSTAGLVVIFIPVYGFPIVGVGAVALFGLLRGARVLWPRPVYVALLGPPRLRLRCVDGREIVDPSRERVLSELGRLPSGWYGTARVERGDGAILEISLTADGYLLVETESGLADEPRGLADVALADAQRALWAWMSGAPAWSGTQPLGGTLPAGLGHPPLAG